MRRLNIAARPDWREQAERDGFAFHTPDGRPYWSEDAYYAFTLRQIDDDIEAATTTVHAMVMELMDEAVRSEALMDTLGIAPLFRGWIAESWARRAPHLYGRMDLGYDGSQPPKLFELNYDTPTSLFEAGYFQWNWLEQQKAAGRLPAGADQFNRIQEALIERFAALRGANAIAPLLHLAADFDSTEDAATTLYLQDCASQAGLATQTLGLAEIGVTAMGRFTDLQDREIRSLFKLYPLEDMLKDEFATRLPISGMQLIEPPWKALLSNKAILALLWDRHPNHPNLLEAFLVDRGTEPGPGWVVKPVHSREGANIRMQCADGKRFATSGPYTEGRALAQRVQPLPEFGGRWPVIGSWVIGDESAGIGIREDDTPITTDTARFLPHAIVD